MIRHALRPTWWRTLAPATTPVSLGSLRKALSTTSAPEAPLRELSVQIRQQLGVQGVCLCDSGTSALQLALGLAVSKGGKVALPAYGCYDLASAAIGAGVRVQLYDIDPATLSPDIDSLRHVLDNGAQAVVVASVFGYTASMGDMAAICAEFGARLIEDIAQAAGARHEGAALGSWGDFTVMSFGRGKGIGGAGGGALGIRRPIDHEATVLPAPSSLAGFRGVGALIAQQLLVHPLLFALPSSLPGLRLGETRYRDPFPAMSIHPVQAALAAAAFRDVDVQRVARARVAARVIEAVATAHDKGCPVANINCDAASTPGFLRVGIHCPDELLARLRPLGARRGYPLSLADLAVLRSHCEPFGTLSGARELAARLASLPTHSYVSSADITRLARIMETSR